MASVPALALAIRIVSRFWLEVVVRDPWKVDRDPLTWDFDADSTSNTRTKITINST